VTTADASALVVDLTHRLSRTRRQRDGWRRVALSALDHIHALTNSRPLRHRAGAQTYCRCIGSQVEERLDADTRPVA